MAFEFVKASLHETDKSYGRIEERTVTISVETDWLEGSHNFSDELRLPGALCMFRVMARTYLVSAGAAESLQSIVLRLAR